MSRSRITGVKARQIWDSRGRPTVEAEVSLACGVSGRAIAPAGASRGSHEAVDLRDGGSRFGGFGVDSAVSHVNGEIASALLGLDAADQRGIDSTLVALDGTANKSRLGGNAVVAVSMATLHAAARAADVPLWQYLAGERPVRIPMPEIQIFGGGTHAGRRTDIQDYMIMTPRAESFREALAITAEVYRAAGERMSATGRLAGVADEGGWWPDFKTNEEALEELVRAIEQAGYRPGEDVW
jgi:enolase